MATAAVLTPGDVPTIMNYYKSIGDEAPFQYVHAPPEGVPKTNIDADPHPVVVHDVRGKEDTVSLDTTGFEYIKHTSQIKDFADEELIKDVYYKEVEEILKKHTGAKRIFIFDHTIRRPDNPSGGTPIEPNGLNRGPVERVHIDQTFAASVERVRYHLPEEAERLLTDRVRIINVWRPISNPVHHKPLAVSDWRYLDQNKDLIPVRFIYPHREGGTYSVKYNPEHKWHYLSNQTPDEVTLIKCFDSKEDRARLTPHSAFLDNRSPESAPPRRSIEVRALVFDTE